MIALRRLLRRRPALAVWLVACALVMTLVVPAGFMPVMSAGTITIEICTGTGPATMVVDMPGMDHHPDQPKAHPDTPCAFAGLAAPSIAATDPVLLAIAIVFVLALGRAARVLPRPGPTPHLRPPLRGPPVIA